MLSRTPSLLRSAFDQSLPALYAARGAKGALLATRDGFLVCADCPDVGDLDVFAAMHATALGASELALQRVGAARNVTLMAESGGYHLVARGVTDRLFAVAIVDREEDCRAVLGWMDALGAAIRTAG